MRLKLLMACLACSGLTSLRASDLPTPGQDYYSLQIASSKDMQAMQTLYQRYAELPFVRLERRGTLYVLRAGFWDSSSSARLALSKVRLEPSLIRIAAYRPETMVAQNWLQETTLPSPAIAAAQRKPEPAIDVGCLASFQPRRFCAGLWCPAGGQRLGARFSGGSKSSAASAARSPMATKIGTSGRMDATTTGGCPAVAHLI